MRGENKGRPDAPGMINVFMAWASLPCQSSIKFATLSWPLRIDPAPGSIRQY